MIITADYHTHTNYSHGKGTPEENVLAAIEKGLRRIAISEHAGTHLFYGVRGNHLLRLRREVDALARRYANEIEVLMGLECNLIAAGKCDAPLPGTDIPEGADLAPFDVLLLGYHKGVWPEDAAARGAFRESFGLGHADPVKVAEALLQTAERYRIGMLSHPCEYVQADIPTLARGAKELGILLEINASHVSMTPAQIREAASYGAKFVIGSDAHTPERVGDFEKAIRAAEEAQVESRIVNAENAD